MPQKSALYLIYLLRFSSLRNLRFEDQIETFSYNFYGVGSGKIRSVLDAYATHNIWYFLYRFLSWNCEEGEMINLRKNRRLKN